MAAEQPNLINALEGAGERLTAPRRAVATLIDARAAHFTAADLLEDARARRLSLGRATVFRTLELFNEMGLLERLDLPNGEHAYVVCAPRHHHHVICSRCGRTSEVADLGLEGVLDDASSQTGYQIEDHRLELYGLCPACRGRTGGS
ncbi:MAG TPA: Fur family transcriptional regulator [Candidatus Limnocylindrales bacterium]|nr:Fur family transcriptional regulator [Candidatus Limnocylindrales bacterium]